MPITTKVVSSNPVHSEVYSIQHYVIKFISDLRLVSSMNKTDRHAWYNWNSVESDLKQHKPNHKPLCYSIEFLVYDLVFMISIIIWYLHVMIIQIDSQFYYWFFLRRFKKIIFPIVKFWTDISCLGGVFAKNTSRETKNFPEPIGKVNLVSRLVFSANTPGPPNIIYLFNYTEYYLEHWLNK